MCAAQDVDVLSPPPESTGGTGLWRRFALPAVLVIVIDQATKVWADNRLTAGPCLPGGDECIDLVLGLRFHLVHNQGAAFSTGPQLGPVFGLVALLMSVVLFNLARKRNDALGQVLLGLIAGGAIGNLIDRIVRADDGLLSGAVIDFIDVQWWPVFNVADSAVVVGVIALIVYSFLEADVEGG
ncbi:MAG: signal peptidase II [Actinomycetia bacterium]|nr:signal peptidase II [Actinomycetes bacterium]MCP5034348.1 signal peptidase II [Actinomycetes bacterium]